MMSDSDIKKQFFSGRHCQISMIVPKHIDPVDKYIKILLENVDTTQLSDDNLFNLVIDRHKEYMKSHSTDYYYLSPLLMKNFHYIADVQRIRKALILQEDFTII